MRRAHTAPSLVALLLALGLVAVACAGEEQPAGQPQGGGQEEGGTIQVAGEEASNHGTEDVAGASEIEMELDDFYFEPTVLDGEAGQTLTVDLFNEGDAAHTFTIDSLGVDETLQPGDEGVTAEVTFPDSGALLFYCRFHAGGGMRGGLSAGGDLEPAAGSGGSGGTGSGDSGGGGGYQGPGY
jgi:plastocyanin